MLPGTGRPLPSFRRCLALHVSLLLADSFSVLLLALVRVRLCALYRDSREFFILNEHVQHECVFDLTCPGSFSPQQL